MTSDREPIEELADEFTARCRQGESPTVEEYVRAHPDLADEIRELFPTIAALERAKSGSGRPPTSSGISGGVDRTHLGDYRLLREIGRGGMGLVYEAEQESLGRRVAVKVLPRDLLADAKQTDRFEREARTAAKLHHTNIVPIFGVGEQDGYHYYVMQLIRGIGLDVVSRELSRATQSSEGDARSSSRLTGLVSARGIDVIDFGRELAANISEGSDAASSWSSSMPTQPLTTEDEIAPVADSDTPKLAETGIPYEPPRRDGTLGASHGRSVARIGLQVADALTYAHSQGTLHRDVKPGNLLLDVDGTVWVADFGLAKGIDQAAITQPGDLVGTLRYMAPEQFRGHTDERSDIYSLGITLLELATLQPAFSAESRGELIGAIMRGDLSSAARSSHGLPRDLHTVLLKATATDPAHRYASAADLAEDLRRFLEDRPVLARRIGPIERGWRWAQRNPVLSGLTVSVAALLVLIAVITSAGYVHTRLANARVLDALDRAERVSRVALDALDTVFDEFAPRQTTAVLSASVSDAEETSDEALSVAVAPVLSKETAELLEGLLPYYDRLAKIEGTSENLAPKIAEANVRVGDIHQRLGQHDKAHKAYERANRLYASLAQERPDRVDVQLALAQVDNKRGQLLYAMHQPEQGRACLEAAYQRLKGLDDSGTSAQTQLELARTCYYLARPHRPPLAVRGGPPGRGKRGPMHGRDHPPPPPHEAPPDGALLAGEPPPPGHPHGPPPLEDEPDREQRNQYLREGVGLLEALMAQHPDVPEYRRLLAQCYCEWPSSEPLPSAREGQDPRDLGLAILEQLVSDHPDVPDYRFDLSLAYLSEPPMPLRWGKDEKSAQRLDRARDLLEDLVETRPNVSDYTVALVHAYLRIGMHKARGGDLATAETDLREAGRLLDALAAKSPEPGPYLVGGCLVRVALAGVLMDSGRREEGIDLLKEALASVRALSDSVSEPTDMHLGRLRRHIERVLEDPERPHRLRPRRRPLHRARP